MISVGILVAQIIAVRQAAPTHATSNVPEASLSAPSSIIADQTEVALILPDRTCGKTYIIERSIDGRTWITIGTTTFATNAQNDPSLKDCENSFVDSGSIPLEAIRGIFYRYRELAADGTITRVSAPGRVELEASAEIDITPEDLISFVADAPISSWTRTETPDLGFTLLTPKFYTASHEFHSEGTKVLSAKLDLKPEERFRLLIEPGSSFPLSLTASRTPTTSLRPEPIISYADLVTEITPQERELRCTTRSFTEQRYEQGGPERTEVHISRFMLEHEADTIFLEFTYGTSGYCREDATCRPTIETYDKENQRIMCGILDSIEFVKP